MERIDFEAALVEVAKLPMVKIDRELFLRKELRNHYSKEVVDLAILHSQAFAKLHFKRYLIGLQKGVSKGLKEHL